MFTHVSSNVDALDGLLDVFKKKTDFNQYSPTVCICVCVLIF